MATNITGLKAHWKETVEAVNTQERAIVLMQRRDMVGVMVPAYMLYEYHRKLPHLSEISPLRHVKEKEYKRDPKKYVGDLEQGMNLIIVNRDGCPLFGVSSRYFSFEFRTNDSGHVEFRDDVAPYMYNDRIFSKTDVDPEQEKRAIAFLTAFAESCKPEPLPEMSEADRKHLKAAIEAIGTSGLDRKKVRHRVNSLSLDVD